MTGKTPSHAPNPFHPEVLAAIDDQLRSLTFRVQELAAGHPYVHSSLDLERMVTRTETVFIDATGGMHATVMTDGIMTKDTQQLSAHYDPRTATWQLFSSRDQAYDFTHGPRAMGRQDRMSIIPGWEGIYVAGEEYGYPHAAQAKSEAERASTALVTLAAINDHLA